MARKVTLIKTWVILSDLQIPWQDKEVIDGLVKPFIKDLKPDGIVLNGDIVDCYSISDFDKNPLNVDWHLQNEIDQAGELMEWLKFIPIRYWLGGNHEDRLRRLAWRTKGLGQLEAMKFNKLFEVAKYGFLWREYGQVITLGNLTVTHGEFVRRHSGASGMATLDRLGTSVLVGHTHRLGSFYRTDTRGVHGAWENGCLCRLDPEYEHFPNWQQGFSVVKVHNKGMFSVQQVPVINRKCLVYGDKEWTM